MDIKSGNADHFITHNMKYWVENKMEGNEVLVWTPELEVSLFHSMKGHKPIGRYKCDTLFENSFVIPNVYLLHCSNIHALLSVRTYFIIDWCWICLYGDFVYLPSNIPCFLLNILSSCEQFDFLWILLRNNFKLFMINILKKCVKICFVYIWNCPYLLYSDLAIKLKQIRNHLKTASSLVERREIFHLVTIIDQFLHLLKLVTDLY